MHPLPSIPSFALVGQPNEGKTTIMATLAEDDNAAISPVPGTTVFCQRYPVLIDGQEVLVFYDTPGFENPEAALQWFRDNQELADPLGTFLRTFRASGEFRQEVEILTPLSEGSAAIYVADASRPVRPVDKQEIEILRLCGARRIGVINSKEGRGEYRQEWLKLMARDFGHVHEFNGHRATFRDRLRLLEASRAVIPEWDGPMERSIQALRDDWAGRLSEIAGLIVGDLKEFMALQRHEIIRNPGDETRSAEAARQSLMEAVRRRERAFRAKACSIFHHSNQKWVVDELLEEDLFSETVWRFLGLRPRQLILAGAVIGATTGGIIDAHAGFASWGAAMVIGGASGAVIAWWSADKAVNITVPKLNVGPLSWGGGKMGGRQIEASISPRSNLLWILLDRYLLYVRHCADWAHGRRESTAVPIDAGPHKIGFTGKWGQETRGKVTEYVGLLRRKRRNQERLDNAERVVRDLLIAELQRLTV